MVKTRKGMTRKDARETLPDELRTAFDQLCDETIAWSKHFYGTQFVSYSILMELVKSGWKKSP